MLREPRPLRPLPIGAATRAATDDVQADAMRQLSEVLRPGVTLRIERTRPTWAAGFLEDYPIEPGDMLRSLLEHLRDEHGGQHYRLTVLGVGDQSLYSGSVPIAGPVRDRGRAITREEWENPRGRERERERRDNPQSSQGLDAGALITLFSKFVETSQAQQEKTNQQTLAAVRDLARTSQQQTSELTNAVLQIRSDNTQRSGLAGQVTELLDGMTAIDQLRQRVGGGSESQASGEPSEGELTGALNQAMTHFVGQFLQAAATRRQPATPRKPAQSPRIVRPHTVPPNGMGSGVGEQPPGIPDAISGQQ